MANTIDWLTVSSRSGSSGQTVLTVTANRNTSLDYKYATITAYNTRYNVSAKTYVTLESYAPMLAISPANVGVPASGGSYSLSITANCDWVITFPSLVSTYSTSAGTGNATVTFSVPSTQCATTLTGNIVVADAEGQVSRTSTIQQYGGSTYIYYNPQELTFPYYGGPMSFAVSANCMYTIQSGNGDWYTFTPGSGTTGETDFTVSATSVNSGTTDRTGTINIVGPEGIAAVLRLTQLNQGQYTIAYTADTSTIDYSGETRTITIDATDFINSSITVSIQDAPDVTYSYSASGLTRGIITLNIPQNPDGERTFTVVVRGRRAMSQNYSTVAIQYTQETLVLNFVTDTSNVRGTGETRTITILNTNINPNRTGLNLPSAFPTQGAYTVSGNVITLTYPQNPSSTSTRTWTIRVLAQTNDGVSLSGSYTITQDAANTYYIPYTADTSTVAATGETRTITIDTSNLVASSITIAAEGASGISTSYSNGVATVTFPPNPGNARNITVVIGGQTQGGQPATATIPYAQSRDNIVTAITLNVDSFIINNGQASVTHTPSSATANIVYSSSDTSVATIDQNGNIIVLSGGTITITATDLVTSLSDSKVVSCHIADYNAPLTFEIIGDGDIVWKATSSSYAKTIEYKKNNGNWTSITSSRGGTSISVATGDVVRFRGNNATYSSDSSRYNTFSGSTAKFEVEGNIMSLIDSENFATATTLASSYTFNQLFCNCTGLTSAKNLVLPATTLTENCYNQMFYECTGLISTPVLPATTMADWCYNSMFSYCTSLTSAPELPATTMAEDCYYYMFSHCTSLTIAPELPATTLAVGCYNSMFWGCTSLNSAPELPATTLANYCYSSMFSNCTSLTTAPSLSATTLADYCYYSMFSECTSLTTVPELPATTLTNYCYYGMFSFCYSLTTAPELPATTLAGNCYEDMFYYCTGLTSAPELPAATLLKHCYNEMFYRCSNLNYIKCLATDISASYCTSNWVNGVSSTGTFVKNANMSSWTTGVNGIPNNWSVTDAS